MLKLKNHLGHLFFLLYCFSFPCEAKFSTGHKEGVHYGTLFQILYILCKYYTVRANKSWSTAVSYRTWSFEVSLLDSWSTRVELVKWGMHIQSQHFIVIEKVATWAENGLNRSNPKKLSESSQTIEMFGFASTMQKMERVLEDNNCEYLLFKMGNGPHDCKWCVDVAIQWKQQTFTKMGNCIICEIHVKLERMLTLPSFKKWFWFGQVQCRSSQSQFYQLFGIGIFCCVLFINWEFKRKSPLVYVKQIIHDFVSSCIVAYINNLLVKICKQVNSVSYIRSLLFPLEIFHDNSYSLKLRWVRHLETHAFIPPDFPGLSPRSLLLLWLG